MKKIITLAMAFFALYTFKINAQNTFPNSDSVINYLKGGWSWFKSCGGVVGICIYPTSPGVGYTESIRFNRISGFNDSITYSVYKNGSLISSGATKVLLKNGQSTWYLRSVAEGSFLAMGFFLLQCQADSMRLQNMCADCYVRTFYRDLTVGISESIASTRVNLFPVPTSDFINVHAENGTVFEKIDFYDINGKVKNLRLVGNAKFDASELPKGMYFIRINTQSQQYWSKFLKE